MTGFRKVIAWVVLGVTSACTNIVVGREASKDGSILITYSSDIVIMPRLLRVRGGTHAPGETVEVKGWETDDVRGRIPQAPRTPTVVGLVNEHHLSMGETFSPPGKIGLIDY